MFTKKLLSNLTNESKMRRVLFVDCKGNQDIRLTKLVPAKNAFMFVHGLVPGNITCVIWYPWMSYAEIDESVDILVRM